MLKNKSCRSRTLLLAIFVIRIFFAQAQSHKVSGYIRDASNGESLIGSTVYDSKGQTGTITNNFGFYSITVRDSAVLSYSFVGYTSKKLFLKISSDTSIIVQLQPGRVLDEVVVRGDHIEKIHETTRTGTVNLPVNQVKSIPAFAGEVDVLKAMQLLPGVSGGNEGASNILVRGGSADQTLILMDGVPIYNPTHLYGLFSSFNADAVNNIELVKSGFPARYGGRLSGIADITLREGNSNKFSGSASLGLLASKLLLEGPIIKGRTSFLVSGRASYISLIKPLIGPKVGMASLDGYHFYDINAKVNHRINARNRLYASVYSGRDRMSARYQYSRTDSLQGNSLRVVNSDSRDTMDWKNLLMSLRWNHEISPTAFFNITAYITSYNQDITSNSSSHMEILPAGSSTHDSYNYIYRSDITDKGLKIDFDHRPNAKHYIRYGAAFIRRDFNPGVGASSSTDPAFDTTPANTPVTTNELNAYYEDDVDITPKLKMNAGVHGVVYHVPGRNYSGIQPRVSLRYSLPGNLAVKASYSYMQQYLQTLVNAGMGMPTEFWVPTTDVVKPQYSHQFSAGAAKTLSNDIEVSVEGFYKSMSNLLEYEEGASYLDNDEPWYEKVEIGKGRSYGAEFFIHKKIGRLTGLASYTLSWNQRRFGNINNGDWFYFRFDRRHDVKITANYKLNEHFDFSATWIYATGNAVTAPVGQYAVAFPYDWFYRGGPSDTQNISYVREYQSRGNYRMQPYHRLDINANYTFSKWGLEHRASIGVYNTYNRLNPFYLRYDYNRLMMFSVSLFPIMPGASYSIKF